MQFVHLHTHSHYSLLDGLAKIDDLVGKAKANGMTALALTDHGSMYGAIEFYQKCKSAGIKPIIGVETYLAPNGLRNKRPGIDDLRYHLILLAKNLTGYKNLLKLVSTAYLEGFYYKPRIDWETLVKHHEGLICCSACLQGEIPRAILSGDEKKTASVIERYHQVFGDDFYLEMQHNPGLPDQIKVNEALKIWSKKFNIPLIASNDIHYLDESDDDAQDVLICLQTKHKKQDRDRLSLLGINLAMTTPQDMARDFADTPQALANTVAIADKCELEIPFGQIQLPRFDLPTGVTPDQQLASLAQQGIAKRYPDVVPAALAERLQYELGVIAKTGFASYFLIVADFVNWAKSNGIVVGPGRGSAAGSIVSYLTNITNVDPLKYDLLFERFLNPERISMPDIDLDFADTRRDEVIRYVETKYGKDHVAQIITFGTMAARVAIRDVGRVLDLPYAFCDRLAKLVPTFATLDEALQKEPDLKNLYDNDPSAKKVIDTAKRLEGVARHTSTHACGVLITPRPLTEYVPLQYAATGDNSIVSQYSLHPVEDLGLLKMDFLGLRNLTILENTLNVIEKIHGQKVILENIALDDKKTFQLLQAGDTTGVFQLESSGMKRYLKQLKPTSLEDIIAMVSLYRPGPMELIPDFIDRKHGKKSVTYLHPKLKPILENTYGIAVYQEQILRMARDLAGFTLGEADVLRKAVGKKIASLLEEQRIKFVDGCVKNGLEKNIAKQVFDFIEPFARYGFNRAHAACYAMIAYQTAYFKANYPTEFMASLLTSDADDIDRVAIEVEETKKMGIEVLPPDVNESYLKFTAVAESLSTDKPRIRFGLLAIKNLGEGISQAILTERKQNGPYKDFEDFLTRVQSKDLNKKSLESLAKSGALDTLVRNRNQVLGNIEKILQFVHETQKEQSSSQASLFGALTTATSPSLNLDEVNDLDSRQKLAWEKEFLGLYISDHPYKVFYNELADRTTLLRELPERLRQRQTAVRVGGTIDTLKKIYTRSGEAMLFGKLADTSGAVEIIIFPTLLKTLGDILAENKIIIVEGKLSDKDGEVKIIVERLDEITMSNLSTILEKYNGPVQIKNGFSRGPWAGENSYSARSQTFAPPSTPTPPPATASGLSLRLDVMPPAEVLQSLKVLLTKYPGGQPVFLVVKNNGAWKKIKTPFRVADDINLQKQLIELLGDKALLLDKDKVFVV